MPGLPPIHDTDPRKTLEMVAQMETRYNSSHAGFRQIASVWILAAFGGIAFFLLKDTTPCGSATNPRLFSDSFLFLVVCILACFGLLLLWLQDQGIYQRLLHSVFAYGMVIEESDSTLPQIRRTTNKIMGNVLFGLSSYYLVPVALFFVAGTTVGLFDLLHRHCAANAFTYGAIEQDIELLLVILIVALAALVFVQTRKDKLADYRAIIEAELAKLPGPPERGGTP